MWAEVLRDFVIWASFCVSNLLTQFRRSWVHSRLSFVFSLPSLWDYPAVAAFIDRCGQTIPCPPPAPPLSPLLFLISLSFILSSVCLHSSALVPSSDLLLLQPFVDTLFQGMCSEGDVEGQTRESIIEEIWEQGYDKEGQTKELCLYQCACLVVEGLG